MKEVRLKAWAKVNLALEVLGRRSDGYHEVRTILQTIDLADDVVLSRAEGLSLEPGPGHPARLEEDLALRAAWALRRAAGYDFGAYIRLTKCIPDAAGLGGGSSDAAATLVGLNRMWGLRLTPERLASLGASLGSDIPFFVRGGTALAAGRGELLTPLPTPEQRWVALVVPSCPARVPPGRGKTGYLYSLLGPEQYSDGTRTRCLAEALRAGHIPEDLLCNAFEAVADGAFPALGEYRKALLAAGASRVHMAGSGPALFSLFATQEEADKFSTVLGQQGYVCYLSRVVGPRTVDEFG